MVPQQRKQNQPATLPLSNSMDSPAPIKTGPLTQNLAAPDSVGSNSASRLQLTPLLKNQHYYKSMEQENQKLRRENREMKMRLEVFSRKLDETLRLRKSQSERKSQPLAETAVQMQLKNAYKQCEIYKREVSNLKKKELLYDTDRVTELTNKVAVFEEQKHQLAEQIKALKKILKQQEKALGELTQANFSTVLRQFESLKQENKKLNDRLSKTDRQERIQSIAKLNSLHRAKTQQQKESEEKKKSQQSNNHKLQILKVKVDKQGKKITYLTAEYNKLKQSNEQLQNKVKERDEQIVALRERLANLRRQIRVKPRTQTEPSQPMASVPKKPDSNSSVRISSSAQNSSLSNPKYPRLMECGSKSEQSYKWNHHQFSSRIKQVKASLNAAGQIKQVGFRYTKGEPIANLQGAVQRFCCEENSKEYVKRITGGFKGGRLSYLEVTSNKGRTQVLGKKDEEGQVQKICFAEGESEYPGAFFGENMQDGINRIGCLVQYLKQQ